MSAGKLDARRYLGRNPDELKLPEISQLAGVWLALELYNPANLALRRIAALGDSPEAAIRAARTGKDPSNYQFILMQGAR